MPSPKGVSPAQRVYENHRVRIAALGAAVKIHTTEGKQVSMPKLYDTANDLLAWLKKEG
jgi:hypothetical protein